MNQDLAGDDKSFLVNSKTKYKGKKWCKKHPMNYIKFFLFAYGIQIFAS